MSIEWFPMFAFGFLVGWWMCVATWPRSGRTPRDQDPDWRRSFNHDNTNKKPTSDSRPLLVRRRPPDDQTRQAFTEGGTIRGNGNGGPTTPKPQFLPGRCLSPDGETIGYRPIPTHRQIDARDYTNPFTGERIPNPPPRNP